MKLLILPAAHGVQWVKFGFFIFGKRPTSFLALFMLLTMFGLLLGQIPVLGTVVSMMMLPAISLGMMALSNECMKHLNGKFNHVNFAPHPPLVMGLLTMRHRIVPLLKLGAAFAFAILLSLAASSLIDGGEFAKFYLGNGSLSLESMRESNFQAAMLLTFALNLPLSAAFWFSPALMHWDGMPLMKSVFFSTVAALRNWRAMTVYSLLWMGLFLLGFAILVTLSNLLNTPTLLGMLLMPLSMVFICLFMASMFSTFVDCFDRTQLNTPTNSAEPL